MRGLEPDGTLKTNAGISGLTNEVNPVRFWAGNDFEGRNNAPFRVRHDGSLVANNAKINGEVEATSGEIGGFEIGNKRIGVANDGYDGVAIHDSFIKFSEENVWAGIGVNVLPASTGATALGRFDNSEQNPYSDNYGVIIRVRNGYKNHALSLLGDIQGFAVASKQIGGNYTATHDDCILSCRNSAAITLTLPTPSASQIGKVYIIKQLNVPAVVISCPNGIYSEHQVSELNLYNNGKRGGACILVNDGQYWMVVADYWG
jgi:hypothetical protein